jgi:ribonuclease P protein component
MRLRRPREFQEVRSLGHRIHCGPFIAQCRQISAGGVPRLGVIASRRVGNAVMRNYGKRLFREIFRRSAAGQLPEGSELVVVLRKVFDRCTYDDLESRLLRACRTFSQKKGNAQADVEADGLCEPRRERPSPGAGSHTHAEGAGS